MSEKKQTYSGLHAKKQKRQISPCLLNLDGQGKNKIDTGIAFFDHMLDGFARHGLFDLEGKSRRSILKWTVIIQ